MEKAVFVNSLLDKSEDKGKRRKILYLGNMSNGQLFVHSCRA